MSEREHTDTSQEEWLGARWSSWGCAGVMISLAIAGLAIITVVYGILTIPQGFGPGGLLSPDPALQPPFEPPPDPEKFIGIPPIGVADFTTGQTLRLGDAALFTVTRTALDWSPPPPRTPEVEMTMAEVRLVNTGVAPIPLSPDRFRMVTAWEWEGPFEPIQGLDLPDLLSDQIVRGGETAEGVLIFARDDIREVRRYLLYDPPFWEGTVRVLLVPGAISGATETRTGRTEP